MSLPPDYSIAKLQSNITNRSSVPGQQIIVPHFLSQQF
jgi:hypothetical protein